MRVHAVGAPGGPPVAARGVGDAGHHVSAVVVNKHGRVVRLVGAPREDGMRLKIVVLVVPVRESLGCTPTATGAG